MSGPKNIYEDPDRDPAAKEKISSELARANLLRMRGDYKGAIDQCLSILKRMPDDLDAHTLIGDIYSESGDLVQAAQWYELALELEPKSQTLRSKLEGVRERAQHKEIAETAEQLGLPTDGARIAIYGAILVIFIVAIGITAYLLGQRHPVAKKSPLPISIEAPGAPDQTADQGSSAGADGGSSEESAALPSGAAAFLPQDDRTLTLMLSRAPLGSHIMSVMSDPRAKVLTINYLVHADEDVREVGAKLARSSFDQLPDVLAITVRATRDDKLVYIADVSRDKMNDAISSNEAQGGQADGWIGSALSYEWSPAPAPTSQTSAPPGSSPPGSNSGNPAPAAPSTAGGSTGAGGAGAGGAAGGSTGAAGSSTTGT